MICANNILGQIERGNTIDYREQVSKTPVRINSFMMNVLRANGTRLWWLLESVIVPWSHPFRIRHVRDFRQCPDTISLFRTRERWWSIHSIEAYQYKCLLHFLFNHHWNKNSIRTKIGSTMIVCIATGPWLSSHITSRCWLIIRLQNHLPGLPSFALSDMKVLIV